MVSEINKQDYLLYKASGAALTADAMLTFYGPGIKKNGSVNIPLYQQMPDWKHISIEVVSTTVTGAGTAGLNIVGKTSNDPTTALTSSSVAAKDGDGSTAFASGNITATGRVMATMVREEAAAASNIGAVLGFLFDKTTLTNWTGDVLVCVTR